MMFRKLFLGGLALMLALGSAIQAVPAFAQSSSVISPAGAPPIVQAEIKSAALLAVYPYQIRISGTLPSACYALKVSTPQVGRPVVIGSETRLSIWVSGVLQPGRICTQGLKYFTTFVRIDPVQLKLPAGRYIALINPVNGLSRFKVKFSISSQMQYQRAVILSAALLESYPPRLKITGTLSGPCLFLRVTAPKVSGNVITILVLGAKPTGVVCNAAPTQRFTTTITLDPVQLKLAPGKYTVLINPVNGQSKFKTVLTVR